MLQQEYQFYMSMLPEWLKTDHGRFVLIKGSELIGMFDTREEAIKEGCRRFPGCAFAAQKIETEDEREIIFSKYDVVSIDDEVEQKMKPQLDYDKIAKGLGVEPTAELQLDYDKIAKGLGAERRGKVPATGGYFGAMQLLADIEDRFRKPAGEVTKQPHKDILVLIDRLAETLATQAPLMDDAEIAEVAEALDQLRPRFLEHALKQRNEGE